MAHNPVQVVLNTKDYFEAPEPGRGGHRKDFFEDRDREFVVHKSRLVKQINSIESILHQSKVQSGFVKVALQKDAIAKSHRPVHSLFPENEFPAVGAGRLGEVYYHVSVDGLNRIQKKVDSAETDTRKKRKKSGDFEAVPSQVRSEVGAVASISLPTASDKRTFSVDEAIKWLRDKRTAGFYVVQLFDVPTRRHAKPEVTENLERLRANFIDGLVALQLGIELFPFAPRTLRATGRLANTFLLRLTKISPVISATQLRRWSSEGSPSSDIDLNKQHHERFLRFLDEQPLVRRITLSPIVVSSKHAALSVGKEASIPAVDGKYSYPRVGIIDGGISNVLSEWIIGRNELVATTDKDASHGTFIAGLLVGGRSFNTEEVAPEADGCEIYDMGLLPDENIADAFSQYYPRGILDFVTELESAISDARQNHRVRIFNMSLNLQDPVEEEQYSPFAAYLDRIADENDALFVISAGNLQATDVRPVWPSDSKEALKQLAERANRDTIFQPAESARSVSVGALNPPGTTPCVAGAPANYSRRGPGLRVGVKPDFAHYGGSLPSRTTNHHGLFSINTDGLAVTGAGTSYSAPLVAKTLAVLNAGIEGEVSRETLLALTVHHARTPQALASEELLDVNRQFIGFGMPTRAAEMLTTEDSRITLVFSDVLQRDSELRFNFVWPQSLTSDLGACRGNVKMTLVYRAPLDERFGSEFVRINLDAHLRQENKDGRFKGRARQIFLPKGAIDAQFESELIEHGLKWWPTKVYEASFKRGVGFSSNWQIVIDSIRRAAEVYPTAGIPFTLVVTISDLEGREPVFDQLRQHLRTRHVQIADIKVAGRVRLRG